jgi:hypothetical protein
MLATWNNTSYLTRSGLGPLYYHIASMDQFRLHFGLPPPHTNVRDKSWDWCIADLYYGNSHFVWGARANSTITPMLHKSSLSRSSMLCASMSSS